MALCKEPSRGFINGSLKNNHLEGSIQNPQRVPNINHAKEPFMVPYITLSSKSVNTMSLFIDWQASELPCFINYIPCFIGTTLSPKSVEIFLSIRLGHDKNQQVISYLSVWNSGANYLQRFRIIMPVDCNQWRH